MYSKLNTHYLEIESSQDKCQLKTTIIAAARQFNREHHGAFLKRRQQCCFTSSRETLSIAAADDFFNFDLLLSPLDDPALLRYRHGRSG